MNTLLLRVAVIAAALMLVCTYATHAQFDTELIKSTEHADCGDSLSLYSLLSSPPVPITRAIDRFHLGLNWYGLDSLTRHFGISLIDNHVYTSGSSTDSTLPRYPDGSRLILVHNDYNLTEPNQSDCYVSTGHGVYNGEGYTLMTRVDPEISVDDTTGLPVIETDTNTGAVHGFSIDTIGTVAQHWLQLRSSDSGTIAGNTNAHLWKTHNPDWLHFSVTGEGSSYPDPTRNGEFMVVGICLRRVGPIDSSQLDSPVVRLRVLRQQRLVLSGVNPVVDNRAERFLRFSLIPRTDVGDNAYTGFEPRQVAADSLPNLFMDLVHGTTDEALTIDRKLEGDAQTYKGMPLAVPSKVPVGLAGREMAWQYMKDVRAVEDEPNQAPDEHEEIVITGQMLQELVDHPNTQVGTTGDDLDGESHWTVFEGLIVFGAVDPEHVRPKLFTYVKDVGPFGLSSNSPNLRFVKNGPRGNGDYKYDQNPGVITDLELEVEYLGNADVDFDYVTFQTPNARALLRDQFRSRVSRQIAATINKVGQVVTNSSLQSKQFTILGVRS